MEPLPSLPIVGQGVRICELHFLLSGVGGENTPCWGVVGGAGGWCSGCLRAGCSLGVSHPYAHLYSQNPRGAQPGGGLCRGTFPGAILHPRIHGQEPLVSRDGPHPVLPCSPFIVLCGALGRLASSWPPVVLQSWFCVEEYWWHLSSLSFQVKASYFPQLSSLKSWG